MNSHCSVCKSLARRLKMFDNMETHMKSVSTKGRTSHFWKTTGSGREILQPQVNKVNQVSQLVLQLPWESTFIGAFHWEVLQLFLKRKDTHLSPSCFRPQCFKIDKLKCFLIKCQMCRFFENTKALLLTHKRQVVLSNGNFCNCTSGVDIKCLRKCFHQWCWYQMFAHIFAPVVLINQMFAQIFSTSGIDIKCVHKCFHLCCWYQIFAQIFSPLVLISNVCTNISTSGIDIKCLRKCFHLWWSGSEAGDGIGCLKLEPAADSKVAKTFKVASPRERF